MGRLGDDRDRALERLLGRVGRLLHTGDLSHVLACSGLDLFVSRRRLEASQRRDVSTHDDFLSSEFGFWRGHDGLVNCLVHTFPIGLAKFELLELAGRRSSKLTAELH